MYRILGRTRDDAAGEAFDKVARAIGLGYPGGPKLSRRQRRGIPTPFPSPLPESRTRPTISASAGLKSAVLNYINGKKMKGESYSEADIAASFQKAVIGAWWTMPCGQWKSSARILLPSAGGVASNGTLRQAMEEACREKGDKILPSFAHSLHGQRSHDRRRGLL